jgi:hypothetical protein
LQHYLIYRLPKHLLKKNQNEKILIAAVITYRVSWIRPKTTVLDSIVAARKSQVQVDWT